MAYPITQPEFDALTIIDGYKQCPGNTDYSAIKQFEWCSFGEGSSFGRWCSFGKWCRFGEWCSFGKRCSFGEGCSFGKGCRFGERCSFGRWCSFGEECSFGEWCRVAGHTLTLWQMRSISGIGEHHRTLYVWHTEDGIYYQAGCRLADKEAFYSACIKKYGENCAYIRAAEFLASEWVAE